MRSSARSVIPTLLLLILAAIAPPDAAAHQRLVRGEPARESVVEVVPRELRLFFAEPVQVAFTRLELIDPDGAPVPLGELRRSADAANVLVGPIEGRLRFGTYTVQWATASQDGHPVRGEYGFTIAEDAEGVAAALADDTTVGEEAAAVPAPGPVDAPVPQPPLDVRGAEFGAESAGYVVIRWVTFVALLGTIGTVAFAVLVLGYMHRRRIPDEQEVIAVARRRAAAVGLACVALLAVATAARLYAQSLAMFGAEQAGDVERIVALIGGSVWGWGWLIQAGATVAAAIGFALARRGGAAGWAIAGVAALALGFTPALSGHAAAITGTVGVIAVVADALHVLAAGGWLGSLLVLVVAGIPAAMRLGPARRGAAVASLVRAFSPTAMLLAGVVLLTGIVATVIHSPSLDALLNSRYGTLLLIKIGVFLLVFGTGAYNYLRVRPALGGDAGTRTLRRSAGFELVVGAVVLLITSVLVATARPYEETAEVATTSQAQTGSTPEAR